MASIRKPGEIGDSPYVRDAVSTEASGSSHGALYTRYCITPGLPLGNLVTPDTFYLGDAPKGSKMASFKRNLDVNAAAINPTKFFKTPRDVLIQSGLTREDKLKILRQWEVDARLLEVAED